MASAFVRLMNSVALGCLVIAGSRAQSAPDTKSPHFEVQLLRKSHDNMHMVRDFNRLWIVFGAKKYPVADLEMDTQGADGRNLSEVMFIITAAQNTYSIVKSNGKILVKLTADDEGADRSTSIVRSFTPAGSPLDAYAETSVSGTYALVSGKSTTLLTISGPAGKETATLLKAKGVVRSSADFKVSEKRPVWKGLLRWDNANTGAYWASKSETDPTSLATISFKRKGGSISSSVEYQDVPGSDGKTKRIKGSVRIK